MDTGSLLYNRSLVRTGEGEECKYLTRLNSSAQRAMDLRIILISFSLVVFL